MSCIELTLFGTPALTWEGTEFDPPPPKVLALLAFLALRDVPCERRDLSELLWETTASGSLRVALSALRGLPGADEWLRTDGQLVRVRADSDVSTFERALREERFAAALEAWPPHRGPLLAGLELKRAAPFTTWLQEQRERLAGARARALGGRLQRLAAEGEHAAALALARDLLDADPLDEAAHRWVMRLEHLRGDTEEALAQFERLRGVLRRELDAEPLPETLDLLAEIQAGGGAGSERAQLLRAPAEVPSRPARLVGREALLARVSDALADGGRVLLHGAGGMGKTALATEAAAAWLAAAPDPNAPSVAPDAAALWLEVGEATPESLFAAAAEALGVRRALARAADPAALLRRELARAGVTLLLLDDVWNAYSLARLSEALPRGASLLASARQRYPGLTRIDVGRLERAAALDLLSLHAGRELGADGAAADLCELLGDHAFGLRVAGVALAAAPAGLGESPQALAARIAAAPHALTLPGDLAEPGRESVAALLEVSLAALPDPAHEALMGLAVCYLPAATPELLALLLRRDVDATEAALMELQRRALAERQAEPGHDVVRYRLHDLTASLARANSHLRERSVRRACLEFLERRRRDFEWLDAEIGNLLAAIANARDEAASGAGLRGGGDPAGDHANGNDSAADFVTAVCLLTVGGAYHSARGHTPTSLALLRDAAAEARTRGDLQAANLLVARLGDHARESLGDLPAALERYEEALDLARAAGDRSREAVLLSLVGAVRFELERGEADAHLQRALDLARASGDRLALAHVLQNLSYVAGARGDDAAAARHSREAVAVTEGLRERVADPAEADHKRFFALFNLGVASARLGDADAALDTLERALAFAEARDNRLWRAYAQQELGDLHHGAGRRSQAQASYEAALALYRANRVRQEVEALTAALREGGYPLPADPPADPLEAPFDDPSDETARREAPARPAPGLRGRS